MSAIQEKTIYYKLSRVCRYITILLCVSWVGMFVYSFFSAFNVDDYVRVLLRYNVLSFFTFLILSVVFREMNKDDNDKDIIYLNVRRTKLDENGNKIRKGKKETVYLTLFQVFRTVFIILSILACVFSFLGVKHSENNLLLVLSIYNAVTLFASYGVCYVISKMVNLRS